MTSMTFTEKARISRLAVIVTMALLAGLYCFGHIAEGKDIFLRCAVSTLPFLIMLPGVIKRQYRSGSLLCFVLLIYFMIETLALFEPGNRSMDILTMCTVVLLFTLSMMYSRWQQRADKLEAST